MISILVNNLQWVEPLLNQVIGHFLELVDNSNPHLKKAMVSLFKELAKLLVYRDKKFNGTQEEFEQALINSTTVYIENMSFYTIEGQV